MNQIFGAMYKKEKKSFDQHANCSRNYQIYFNSDYPICRIFIFAIYFCDDLTSKTAKKKGLCRREGWKVKMFYIFCHFLFLFLYIIL